jgi:FAD-dependent urate hydroxylase
MCVFRRQEQNTGWKHICGWFRRLTVEEKQALNQRFWDEGRLKLEPWLKPRIDHDPIKIWPTSQVVSCQQLPQEALEVTLSVGERLTVDHCILATGYQVNMANIPFLRRGNILPRLHMRNGYPMLDAHFQSNLPGLFITSMAASQAFGAFFCVHGECRGLSAYRRIISKELRSALKPCG